MARKKAVKSVTKRKAPVSGSGLLDYFRFGESYTSLVLGIIVVILAVVLVAALFRSRDFSGAIPTSQDTSSTQTGPEGVPGSSGNKKTYTVKQGDTLWSIAESTYNNGYRWVDIVKANGITNADTIAVGTKLILPGSEIVAKPTTVASPSSLSPPATGDKITADTYTIKLGDTLWDISVRTYGTGYRWPEIARNNAIANPNLIYAGNSLKLPKT